MMTSTTGVIGNVAIGMENVGIATPANMFDPSVVNATLSEIPLA